MPQDWDEWFRQAREEGMTRREVRDHLQQQGYDPDRLMQQYWPRQTDDQELTQQARTQEQRQASMVTTTDTHRSTVLTVFSSPSGFFRRIQPTLSGAGRFLAINLSIFLLLGTVVGTLTGMVVGDQGLTGLLTSSFLDSIVLSGQLLGGGGIIAIYLYLIFGLLKGELSLVQILSTVMYGSVVLLGAWFPIIGRFFCLYAFTTIKEGLEEQIESKGHSYTLILAPAALFAFVGLIRTLL